MKAEELMLGDWVYGLHPDGSRYANPFRISAVDIYPLNRSPRIVTIGGYGFQEEHLEPIPLTSEILEKNGFKDIDKGENCDGFDIYWRNENDGYSINTQDLHLHYVHELQHALRLCGIKKEIEL